MKRKNNMDIKEAIIALVIAISLFVYFESHYLLPIALGVVAVIIIVLVLWFFDGFGGREEV